MHSRGEIAAARAAGDAGTAYILSTISGVALEDVKAAARGTQNLLVPMRVALAVRATLGEVSDALREEFGVYHPTR